MSPLQRSLKLMRDAGWFCEKVERWCPFSKRRIDLLGFGDLLCIRGDEVRIVQTTVGSAMSKRVEKIRGLASAKLWVMSHSRTIHVHGWRKSGARGKRKTWTCRVLWLTSESLGENAIPPINLSEALAVAIIPRVKAA